MKDAAIEFKNSIDNVEFRMTDVKGWKNELKPKAESFHKATQ